MIAKVNQFEKFEINIQIKTRSLYWESIFISWQNISLNACMQ